MVKTASGSTEKTDLGAMSNTQIAVQTIKRLIVENELAAGSNHLESELATMLGMSRTPVREATLILEAQGLLEVRRRHGVKIMSLSIDDMSEVYQILTSLESLSAQLAAGKSFPDSEFEAAEAAIQKMDEALENDDLETWALADEAFHNELVRLGGNRRLASVVMMYNDQVRRVRNLTLHLRPKPKKSNDDHRKVLAAIQNGQPDLARSIHEHHRIQSGAMLVELLKKYNLHNV